ncbi:hypothetical protein H6P81_016827 [Aristolochia fimbriata]|uniref:TRAF-type domain-containing protein n=1 Tax=Aristolochia fimbriata TaxID=158543 RepID=A0AAV7ECN1_ARIFI|nr:hypothetical protein H6P81_016827 [Aristolochia fimbriata]
MRPEEPVAVQENVDVPVLDVGSEQKKVEAMKGGGSLFSCGFCDIELVHKLAQVLLMGLSAACVDNTTGDLFKSPALVAVNMRKEMVEYLIQRSDAFVAETLIAELNEGTETFDNPIEVISIFLDDFLGLKRNLPSRVSSWLIGEWREDKIDEFVHEMVMSGFWLMDRRKSVAEMLLKNVDHQSIYHCNMKFESIEELQAHKTQCKFRAVSCSSEGCRGTFCAMNLGKHESTCPFKLLQCEQKCPEIIMRCEMDKHCITVCPMRLINCPFHQVGCQSAIPGCTLEQHCSEFLQAHVLQVLCVIHKDGSEDDLRLWLEQLKQLPSFNQLAEGQTVRALTWKLKDLEAEL